MQMIHGLVAIQIQMTVKDTVMIRSNKCYNVAEATGGDEGNRTPVQNNIKATFYRLSLSFNIPSM